MKKKSIIITIIIILLLCVIGGAIWFISTKKAPADVAGNDVVTTEVPTEASIPEPTEAPTPEPTEAPTLEPTEAPIPEPTEAPIPEPTESPIPESTEEPTSTSTPELPLQLELKDTDHPRIMEILDLCGIYTDSVNNEGSYSYQIPQFRADSDSAKSLNQRIVDDILPYVEGEVHAMLMGYSLVHYGIHYEITEYEDIVSIMIKIPFPNDGLWFYVYNYDFAKDRELTNADILAEKGMTEKVFLETAYELQRKDLDSFFDNIPDEYKEEYLDVLKEANALTTVDSPMYLDEDGILNVAISYVTGTGEIREGIFKFE